jgi:transitional endoplasmic reticulum ATPase
MIDPALLRPGRFDRLIYIPEPDYDARKEIFKIHTRGKPMTKSVKLDKLAKDTETFSGADIAAVCNEAVMLSIREYVQSGGTDNKDKIQSNKIAMKHFIKAIEKVKPEKLHKGIQKNAEALQRYSAGKSGQVKSPPSRPEEEIYV